MRSLRNPYVVGQAFFWGLKSNLYLKVSYERYYVLLEQFLMLSGRFVEELWLGNEINFSLQRVQKKLMKSRKEMGLDLSEVKKQARQDLYNERQRLPTLFTMAIEPKVIIRDFMVSQCTVFSSAKLPQLVKCVNH